MPNENIDWFFITEQIYRQNLTPVISNELVLDNLFGKDILPQQWAAEINFPFKEDVNLTRVAQYVSISQQDVSRAKTNYLRFLKQQFFALAEGKPDFDPAFMAGVRSELRGLTLSELVCERLRLPNFETDSSQPLSVLAALDIPVYLTTSHHHFLEAALRTVGKTPRTEVYGWREGLADQLPFSYQTDHSFEPTISAPLVYHLHGIDDNPDWLVLTEDDQFEFLVNIVHDFQTDAIPNAVRNAVTNSLLVLLGYDLYDWDLRVILQGLIKGKPRRPRSFAIQLRQEKLDSIRDLQQFEKYLADYFTQVNFDVFWGSVETFTAALWREWQAS